jgi:hypothetical protein
MGPSANSLSNAAATFSRPGWTCSNSNWRVDEHQPTGTATAFTVGGGRRVLARRGFEGVLAVQMTVNKSPEALRSTHGSAPVAGQIYFRLRLPGMRMWQMRMSAGMGH